DLAEARACKAFFFELALRGVKQPATRTLRITQRAPPRTAGRAAPPHAARPVARRHALASLASCVSKTSANCLFFKLTRSGRQTPWPAIPEGSLSSARTETG